MISLRRIISLAESRKGPHWDGYYEMISQTVKGSLFADSHIFIALWPSDDVFETFIVI